MVGETNGVRIDGDNRESLEMSNFSGIPKLATDCVDSGDPTIGDTMFEVSSLSCVWEDRPDSGDDVTSGLGPIKDEVLFLRPKKACPGVLVASTDLAMLMSVPCGEEICVQGCMVTCKD